MLLLLITTTDQVPKSRKSILQTADGAVMPAGVLANIDNLNYDYRVHNCLGTNNNAGIILTQILILTKVYRQRKNAQMVGAIWTYS